MHRSYFWRDQTEISNPATDNQMAIFKALGVAPHLIYKCQDGGKIL